ncbi:MAG: hypothetical protein U0V48_18505 [Anaerolineales bacterium]
MRIEQAKRDIEVVGKWKVDDGKRKKKDESAFWKSQRPLFGALIGIFVFLAIFLPLKFLDYNSIFLYKLALNLELFGRMTVIMLGTASELFCLWARSNS